MVNPLLKAGKDALIKGVGIAAKQGGAAGIGVVQHVAHRAVEFVAKQGDDFIEKQKSLVKIPDLKDVHIDEAIRILRDELNLIPTSAIANPSLGYADESENEVMYSEPKFGSKVDPKTTVKVYYLTQEVINKSQLLLEKQVLEFLIPKVIGLNIYEAREDLEALGLKVSEKLEKPDVKFIGKEDGQVTRVTYPDNKKIGAKFKTGERLWVYYVNEDVLSECKSIKEKKVRDDQERMDKIKKAAVDMKDGLHAGAVDNAQKFAEMIKNPLAKKTK